MYQAALQLNGAARNHYNSPVKNQATDYIEVVSTQYDTKIYVNRKVWQNETN